MVTLTTANGLPCNTVHWIIEDDLSSYWLYTQYGLLCIARTELDAWTADPKRMVRMTAFDAADGIRLVARLMGFRPFVTKSSDGKIWFRNGETVSFIDPSHIVINTLPIPVHIEQITANGKTYDAKRGLRLPPLVHDLTIDYTALSFTAPEKVHFRYQLEGQDPDWREVVNKREVQYSNLPPRKYRFRVTASNESGVWNNKGDVLDFSVAAAYYQTNWFRALCAAIFLALLVAAYQFRVRHLRREFKQLRDVIETVPAMAWTARPDGSNAFVNRRWSEYIGLSAKDTPIFGWTAAVHPDDRQVYSDKWRASLATGEPFECEARFRCAGNGEYRWFLARGVPLRDGQGNVRRWYGILTDIDDRKHAEQALRRSEAYLAGAQRLTHTSAWVSDRTAKPLYWSEEVYRLFGFDPQQGLPTGDQPLKRIHPEDRDRFLHSFQRAIREKVDAEEEFKIVLPDGTVRHVHALAHPVLSATGEVFEVVGTTVDVTERKRAEQALRESETRFRTFVDHAADALFIYDLEQKAIVDVNRQACESLGYTRQELIGNAALAFHLDSDRAQIESVAKRAAAGEAVIDTHWHQRKDKTLFPVEAHTSYYWYGGRRFLLKVARDVSDRVQAEQEREKLRRLEADLAHIDRVSMMGQLTASIAHEINQPLSGVVSNASAGLRWLAGEVPNLEEVREGLRRIVRDGKRAGEVIARIRALTRRTVVIRERLDPNEIVRDVLALVGAEAKKESVTIQTQFADDLGPVAGDRVQLQQVVLNLVINAIEAMSSVRERARELVITTRNIEPDQVQITVEDSGMGVDSEKIDKIFESFYTTKSGGMGMGLSISRSIIQAHGGRLWAAAKEGPGAIFYLTLAKYHEEESSWGAAGV